MERVTRNTATLSFAFISFALFSSLQGSGSVSFDSPAPAPRTSVVLQLDWIFNAQFAGLYQAVHRGYFRDAGMDVDIRPVSEEMQTVAAVLAMDQPVFGVAESTVLLQEYARGAAITALVAMFQDSPMGWMFLEGKGIASIEDFRGRKVGIHPDGGKALELALSQNGVKPSELEITFVGHDPKILLDGSIDVMQGYYIDEFVRLDLVTGGRTKMILARDHGYVAYSQVIFVPDWMFERHAEIVPGFIEAVRKGWEYALDNEEETIDLLIAKYNPEIDRIYQIESLKRIRELVRPGGNPALPPLQAERWKISQERFLQFGVLERPVDVEGLLRQSAAP